MAHVNFVKVVVAALTIGLKLVIPSIAVLVTAHFNPAQVGALSAHPFGLWGRNP